MARDEMQRKHNDILKRIRTKTMTGENLINAKRDGALSRYYGVLWSISDLVKAADKRDVNYTDMLTLLQHHLEESCDAKASSLAGPFQF